jgi:hypothetical protein
MSTQNSENVNADEFAFSFITPIPHKFKSFADIEIDFSDEGLSIYSEK